MTKNKTIPPKVAKRLLLLFLRDDLAEEVQGDLEEKFLITLKNKSRLRAQLNYWYQVLNYLRPFAIRKTQNIYINDYAMFQSYFKIGWRNMRRNVGYTSINVGGLAVGMAVAILNGLWIWDELSFNKYYENYDRIAQVAIRGEDNEGTMGRSDIDLSDGYGTYRTSLQPFQAYCQGRLGRSGIFSWGEKIISVRGISVDAGAPDMFTLKMKYGSRDGLQEAHSIMIAASVSKTLFGDEDPTNKIITINNSTQKTINGVYEDFPLNTKFADVKCFTPFVSFLRANPWIEKDGLNDWRNHFIQTYAEILPDESFESINEQIKNIIQVAPEDTEKGKRQAMLFPMSRWHLFPFDNGRGGTVNKDPSKWFGLWDPSGCSCCCWLA